MQGVPDTKRGKQVFSSLPHLSQSFLLFSIPVNRLDLSKGSASKRGIQIHPRSELYGHHSPSFEKFIISLYSKWWSQLFNAGDTSIIRRTLTEILEKIKSHGRQGKVMLVLSFGQKPQLPVLFLEKADTWHFLTLIESKNITQVLWIVFWKGLKCLFKDWDIPTGYPREGNMNILQSFSFTSLSVHGPGVA